jgi:hypothetical protein
MTVAVRLKVLTLSVVMLLAGAGLTAWAQTSTGPATFTGCLTTATGDVGKLKRGSSPLSACVSGETQVRFSAGDITEIVTPSGSGLTGGAAGGVVTLGLNYTALNKRYAAVSPATRACFDAQLTDDVDLSHCFLQRIVSEGVTMRRADLRFVDLTGADISGAVLSDSNLSRSVLRYADLRNAFLPNVNLSRADLYGALLDGANLNGVTWQATICPDGTNSNANGNTCVGHLTPQNP